MTASARPATGRPITGWPVMVMWLVVVMDVGLLLVFTAENLADLFAAVIVGAVLGGVVAAFGVVGAILATRLPHNPIGWIFWVSATVMALSLAGVGLVPLLTDPATGGVPFPVALIALIANVDLVPLVGVIGIFVPLLFPTGRPPTPAWRRVAWLGVTAIVFATGYFAVLPGPMNGGGNVVNPIGVAALAPLQDVLGAVVFALLIASLGLAASSVVWRYRHSAALERQQLRWFAYAVAVMAGAVAIGIGDVSPVAEWWWVVMLGSLGLVPIAAGVAILRYRLYDLDRLVSRTVTYGLVTGLLLGAYGGLVLVLEGPLGTLAQGDTLSVAISTLVVAALFQPVRGRVQGLVDRRFDRPRFDAERMAVAFSGRLRDQVDLPTLLTELDSTVRQAVSPASIGVWMRE